MKDRHYILNISYESYEQMFKVASRLTKSYNRQLACEIKNVAALYASENLEQSTKQIYLIQHQTELESMQHKSNRTYNEFYMFLHPKLDHIQRT